MNARSDRRQGVFELGADAPPPSLLEDDEIELGDLATVPYVERQSVELAAGAVARAVELEVDWLRARGRLGASPAPAGYVWPFGQAGVDSEPVDPMRSAAYRRRARAYIRGGPEAVAELEGE